MSLNVTMQMIALLGRRDTPVDGVEDYCALLGQAFVGRKIEFKTVRVNWEQNGWLKSLLCLWKESADWRGSWVALQYTALGWSRRGFPVGTLAVLGILRSRGARCAVVFHEARHQGHGSHRLDRVRAAFQDMVIRSLYNAAEKAIFTVPLTKVSWLHRMAKAAFIPIGANIPERSNRSTPDRVEADGSKKVAVFCFSSGVNRRLEIEDILHTMRSLADGGLKQTELLILGKGSEEAGAEIRQSLQNYRVNVRIFGMLPAEQVSQVLASADVLLFVSGHVAQTRGSALAGIACGLPIVGYSGSATGTPIERAGLELVDYRDKHALARALYRVLSDDAYRARLRDRSCAAQESYFSWGRIANAYIESLQLETELLHDSSGAKEAYAPAQT